MINDNIKWLYSLKDKVPIFLDKIQGRRRSGFFRYSYSGDLFGERLKWGLGNSVFFLKIVYTLKLEDRFKNEINEAGEYIKSFQRKDGIFFDPLINVLSKPLQTKRFLKSFDIEDLLGVQTKRAETRQSLSALNMFNITPIYKYGDFPKTKDNISTYLLSLDWSHPWGAGSHFSHLLFFLQYSDLADKEDLIYFTIELVNKMQNSSDGLWYTGSPGLSQKINGGMKIITGLKAVGKLNFKYAKEMLDTALIATNDEHACDNFNVTYVIKYCNEILGGTYRFEEIKKFLIKRLSIYREYYYNDLGGFSFKKNQANRVYYNAPITRGYNEPDIHGTVMFLWGISLIAQVLGLEKEVGFREFIT